MMRSSLLVALCLAAGPLWAAGNEPAAAAIAAAAEPPSAAANTVVPLTLDSQLQELTALQRQTEVATARLNLHTLNQQIEQLAGTGGATSAARRRGGGGPTLVGMVSNRQGMNAEFVVDGALVRATVGELVGPWKVASIHGDAVELVHNTGRGRQVLAFGAQATAP